MVIVRLLLIISVYKLQRVPAVVNVAFILLNMID